MSESKEYSNANGARQRDTETGHKGLLGQCGTKGAPKGKMMVTDDITLNNKECMSLMIL